MDVDLNVPPLQSLNCAKLMISLAAVLADEPHYLLVDVPPLLPNTALQNPIYQQAKELRNIAQVAMRQIEADYVQIQLMNLENARLRQAAFAQEQKE